MHRLRTRAVTILALPQLTLLRPLPFLRFPAKNGSAHVTVWASWAPNFGIPSAFGKRERRCAHFWAAFSCFARSLAAFFSALSLSFAAAAARPLLLRPASGALPACRKSFVIPQHFLLCTIWYALAL